MDADTPKLPPSSIPLYTVHIHEGAYEDLHGIQAHISERHPENAERYIQRIIAAMEKLRTLPNA